MSNAIKLKFILTVVKYYNHLMFSGSLNKKNFYEIYFRYNFSIHNRNLSNSDKRIFAR
jgi:hypothetical protein